MKECINEKMKDYAKYSKTIQQEIKKVFKQQYKKEINRAIARAKIQDILTNHKQVLDNILPFEATRKTFNSNSVDVNWCNLRKGRAN